jgi:hypothetical protein
MSGNDPVAYRVFRQDPNTMLRTLTTFIALVGLLHLQGQGLGITSYITHATCGSATGSINAYVYGGEWPYTYLWSNGATTSNLTNVAPGIYTVTVWDNQGATYSEDLEILSTTALFPPTGPSAPIWTCDDPCSSWIYVYNLSFGGTGPYSFTFDPPGPIGNGNFQITNLCEGNSYMATISDSQGCTGQYGPIVVESAPVPNIISSNLSASCPDGATGSMTIEYDLIDSLFVSGPNNFFAVPIINPFTLTNLAPGTYYLQGTILQPDQSPGVYSPTCYYIDSIVVPVTAEPCGALNGTMFADIDDECMQDSGEPGLAFRVMSVEPGGHLVMTTSDGTYASEFFYNSYTLNAAVDQYAQNCVTLPAPFTLDANTPSATIDLPFAPSFGPDLELFLYMGPHVPGMDASYTLHLRNDGPYTFSNVVLDLTMDAMLTYAGSSVVPTLIETGHLRFTLSSLSPFTDETISAFMTVPPNGNLIGTILNGAASATADQAEADMVNNTSTMDRTITGSYDPNDKLALTSSRTSDAVYYLDEDSWVDYTIRFQNTGTALAYNVYLLDTISPLLDLTSFQILGATHAFEASLDDPRVLRFDFPNILLPDSGADMAGSQGHISFRLKPVDNLAPGMELVNAADIFFDFNEPVRTNDAVLEVEQNTAIRVVDGGSMFVHPNPASDVLWIDLPDGRYRIDVLMADGRTAITQRTHSSTTSIDTRKLPAGAYNIRTTDANGAIRHARFVKN